MTISHVTVAPNNRDTFSVWLQRYGYFSNLNLGVLSDVLATDVAVAWDEDSLCDVHGVKRIGVNLSDGGALELLNVILGGATVVLVDNHLEEGVCQTEINGIPVIVHALRALNIMLFDRGLVVKLIPVGAAYTSCHATCSLHTNYAASITGQA